MGEFLTLKDHVYNYIAEQINQGELVPGEKINENSISDKLNISRTPVREALIQLSAEGLLENTPRKGFVIRHLSTEEAKETYFLIGLLDGAAIELACPFIDQKRIADMEYYVGSMDLAIEKGNCTMYYKMQEEFHEIYLSVCPNESLVRTLAQLKKKFMKKLYEPDITNDIQMVLGETNSEHKTMLEMIRKGDAKGVAAYLRDVHWDPKRAYMESL